MLCGWSDRADFPVRCTTRYEGHSKRRKTAQECCGAENFRFSCAGMGGRRLTTRPPQTVKKVVSQKIMHKKFSGRTRTAKPSWNQKAVDSKGKAFGRVPPDAKFFAFIRIRKGDATARWAVVSWETLSRGFPMRRLTPHLGNLLPANQFFDTLGRPPSYDAAAFLSGIR